MDPDIVYYEIAPSKWILNFFGFLTKAQSRSHPDCDQAESNKHVQSNVKREG